VNWEMLGALGEIAGAVAVVISLVYLARQIGVSNRLARAEAWRASYLLTSAANLFSQVQRQVDEGVLPAEALSFTGRRLFRTPYFRDTWPLIRPEFDPAFVRVFEREFGLPGGDASIAASSHAPEDPSVAG